MKNYLDDFLCQPNCEELEEEFEAWLQLMQPTNVKYLTEDKNYDIINT